MINYPNSWFENTSSLKEFLNLNFVKLLPDQDIMIKNHINLMDYLKIENPFLVLRKFKNYSNRGSIYSFENYSFTVCDNEPALWVFMESYCKSELNFLDTIQNQQFPIAFALKKEEKKGNIWQTKGRKHKDFSANGWKHCHIFQCSPLGESINNVNDLKRRTLRLLSPLNHFPFFSPKKYEMPFDYGENKDVINYIIWWLYNNYYSETNKIVFKNFVEEQGFTIAIKEPKDIKIVYAIKNKKLYKEKEKNKKDTTLKSVKVIPTIFSMNKIKDIKETKCFKLSKNWYDLGLKIKITFNDGRVFEYHHDEVYKNTISHYAELDCWKKYGCYSNSTGIPNRAKKYVNELL